MKNSLHTRFRRQWIRRLFDAVISNLSAAIAVLLLVVPATVWWFSESAKEIVEGNSYRIESIDRYAAPSNTYTQLIGSERRSTIAPTRIAIVFSSEAPCSQQSPQTNVPLDRGTIIGTMPSGLLATIRYTRRATINTVNFEITSGRILFIAMQGDLPRRTCFNERRDQVVIEYAPSDLADISPRERILFIQTDEPASDVGSKILRERSSAYFAVASLAGVCIFVFLAGLLGLIIRNGRHDRNFEKDATLQLENVKRDSVWIIENLQRSSSGQASKNVQERRNILQELKQQGTADGERRFKAGVADSRQRFARRSERESKSKQRRKADPRVEIRNMKLDVFE